MALIEKKPGAPAGNITINVRGVVSVIGDVAIDITDPGTVNYVSNGSAPFLRIVGTSASLIPNLRPTTNIVRVVGEPADGDSPKWSATAQEWQAGTGSTKRIVRGINYVAKNSAAAQSVTFNRDDWDLDRKYVPRFQNMDVTGHSWTQYSPRPGGLWHTRVHRYMGIPDVLKRNIGVSGGVAMGPMGGFPGDGQAARSLQQNVVETTDVSGVGPLSRNWSPYSSLVPLVIGYNDYTVANYYGAQNWELGFKPAMRAYFSAWRAGRRYLANSAKISYNGSWTQTNATNLNMGTTQATATGLSYVAFPLPSDYMGQPVAFHYHMDNTAAFQWYVNVYLGGTVVSTFNTLTEAVNRGYGTAANGSNPGGGVTYPGAYRYSGFTAADAGKTVTLEFVAPNSGDKASFDGITFEVDTPIMVISVPYLPISIGGGDISSTTSPNGRQIRRVNELLREVVDEFPANSIAFTEHTTGNQISNEDGAAWYNQFDPHLSTYGNGLLARHFYNNLSAATLNERILDIGLSA